MTKRLIDLTDNDLIQMDEEQLRNLIDYECALAGVPLLPKLPIEPKQRREDIEPDLTLYKLGEFYFETQDEALDVLGELMGHPIYDLKYLRNSEYNEAVLLKESDYNYPKVSLVRAYSPERWSYVQEQVEENKRNMDAYEEEKATYNDLYAKYVNVSEQIYKAREAALQRAATKESIRAKFTRYLELAGDNDVIAMKFLLDAHPEYAEANYVDTLEILSPMYFAKEKK